MPRKSKSKKAQEFGEADVVIGDDSPMAHPESHDEVPCKEAPAAACPGQDMKALCEQHKEEMKRICEEHKGKLQEMRDEMKAMKAELKKELDSIKDDKSAAPVAAGSGCDADLVAAVKAIAESVRRVSVRKSPSPAMDAALAKLK